jgi:UDP-N-acetylmuramoylalanine--D-glutamate ligase
LAQTGHNTDSLPRTLIVGLGSTGLSCARFLAGRGEQLAIADSRSDPPGLAELQAEMPDIAVFLGPFADAPIATADRLVVSPGVAVSTPEIAAAQQQGVPVIGDIELFAQYANAPVVAITGSNGKSTVTTIVGEMAQASGVRVAVGGNLGTPALDLLDDEVELYVLELSSFQLETTYSLKPAVAAVLNISADHMDRYRGVAAYAATKARIFNAAGVGVFNADDPMVAAMQGADDRWYFTLGDSEDRKMFGVSSIDDKAYLCRGEQPLIAVDDLQMPGAHNRANALAALAIGTALGLELNAMLNVLRRFPGLPHRTEFVAEIRGVRWYNDSKGTNVGAAIAALRGLDTADQSRTVLIAGGDCKGADFSELAPVLEACARAVILIGRDAPMIAAVIPQSVVAIDVTSMQEAVERAAETALPGDRVLLSPGCASFDMFSGFAERGEVFKRAVKGVAS